jgi:hypothetical protein
MVSQTFCASTNKMEDAMSKDGPKYTSQSPRRWLPGMTSGDTVARYLDDQSARAQRPLPEPSESAIVSSVEDQSRRARDWSAR